MKTECPKSFGPVCRQVFGYSPSGEIAAFWIIAAQIVEALSSMYL
jgi:hypothetical protein